MHRLVPSDRLRVWGSGGRRVPAAPEIFYIRKGNGKVFGPFPLEVIELFIIQGKVVPSDLVRQKGSEVWGYATQFFIFPGAATADHFLDTAPPSLRSPARIPKVQAEIPRGVLLARALALGLDGLFLVGFADLVAMAAPVPVPALVAALSFIYFPWLESSPWQATLGKRLAGIQVAGSRRTRLTFGQALGRHLARGLSALPLGLGFLSALWHPRRLAYHDELCGSHVRWRRPVSKGGLTPSGGP